MALTAKNFLLTDEQLAAINQHFAARKLAYAQADAMLAKSEKK